MLSDMISALAKATTEKEKERAYRKLEKMGMDRMSANIVVREMKKRGEI